MSLLSGFKKGDKKALEHIYLRYYKRVYLLSLHFTGSPPEAEDLVHDIFLRLYRGRDKLSDEVPLEAQLVRIAKFHILDTLKKKKNIYVTGFVSELQTFSDDEDSENGIIYRKKLLRAMEALPAKCKEIFTLYRLEGLTRGEIAAYKNISVKTVENQISKAIRIIRKEVESM
ncbi:RNA polymerase sigma-70 factor, ECF subfamily [Sinomicrobium oceani]|uniref:RNA polymerase sigma-70 factor, ECF subfamily n=1 Tax=Sinomicrobium oceani TaxID=1150368 RepID=A0A1K1PUV9_9FLAO|nr:sigma-70 family RNA polymerase sigma factor [Sinomicrobium oceani]SFW51514.1 RNA polymerase sigma-70 factor, ECF subfamily [Sinomicrobium oceani]